MDRSWQNAVLDFSVDGSNVQPRRMPVETAACESCHSEFSFGFSLHGNLRNQVEYCVLCHNPNKTDFDRRKNAIALGGDAANETINLKHLIHKLHRGEEMAADSYLIYGFGSAPLNFAPHDFKEIGSQGIGRLHECHTNSSHTLFAGAGAADAADRHHRCHTRHRGGGRRRGHPADHGRLHLVPRQRGGVRTRRDQHDVVGSRGLRSVPR
jgi:OmcA/MtrC family decaheme c-type cytochrome